MSLSERLNSAEPRRPNRGCETCHWFSGLPKTDQESFKNWVDAGWSIRQLHHICSNYSDHPLHISVSALKNHLRECLGSQ